MEFDSPSQSKLGRRTILAVRTYGVFFSMEVRTGYDALSLLPGRDWIAFKKRSGRSRQADGENKKSLKSNLDGIGSNDRIP